MKVITYFLYGDNKNYQLELAFSIISALRLLKDNPSKVIISVISDQKDFALSLPVDYISFSQDELIEWTQNGNYKHRAKMCALMKVLDHYQASVIMVDTDTYFINDPSKLFDRVLPQTSLMHCKEEKPIGSDPVWKSLVEKIGHGIEVRGINISPQSPMFNSGVVGVDFTNRALLEESLKVNDELYSLSPIFNVEQFAIGTVLNRYTDLLSSDDIVKHYYGVERNFIHIQISRFLEEFKAAPLDALIAASDTLKLDLPSSSLKDRIVARILAFVKHWNGAYQFAYLAYHNALHCASSEDIDYANAWASLTLRMAKVIVSQSAGKQQIISNMKNDFQKFGKDKIGTLTWIDSDIRSNWLQFWEGKTALPRG